MRVGSSGWSYRLRSNENGTHSAIEIRGRHNLSSGVWVVDLVGIYGDAE